MEGVTDARYEDVEAAMDRPAEADEKKLLDLGAEL